MTLASVTMLHDGVPVSVRVPVPRREIKDPGSILGLLPRPFPNLLSRDCERPVYVDAFARWQDVLQSVRTIVRRELWVRCRRCESCLSHRARVWIAKAMSELEVSGHRTWVSTLTFRRQNLPPEGLIDYCNLQLTLFFKRLRKMGSSFRYLAVMELQTDGTPHFHVLLHEMRSYGVTWKNVDDQWKMGFHKTNLLKGKEPLKAVGYACKYMLKSQLSRIRASIGYGDKDRSQTFYQNKASDIAQRDLSSLSGSQTIPPPTPTNLNSQASRATTWSKMFTTFGVGGTDLKVPNGASIPDG